MDNVEEEKIYKKIEELSVPILESLQPLEIENFSPFYLRYYEDKYCVAFNDKEHNHDILLRFHSNRLVLISIAKGHDIFKGKLIEKIDFNVNGRNLKEIIVSGKKKNGAKKLNRESVLCYLQCKDDENRYPIYTSILASLIEINSHILKDPQLLVSDYKKLGYIGVLYPKCYGPYSMSVEAMAQKYNLLSEKEYEEYLSTR
ncbi:protein Abitram-like [Sitophilus oryzae]|uniref:Protein Abitram-like n=1 Tax=Sitophilus oryzae TaxID=7048 RepID=A0A6J2XQA6_SITOR|nr:protein Abitram-like [Sitophilus oryzae]